MDYERPYYEDLNYHPLLFYVVFGVEDEELSVSRERHHVDEFPEGLDMIFYKKPEHSEYMSSMLEGTLGEILKEDNPVLYEAARNSDGWAVIRGEVVQDTDLNYMRNAIGFVQALVEKDAVGVLDLQTFKLFSSEEWTENFFSKEFDAYHHVVILASQMEDGSIWLHTRGMRKFGRPDMSLKNVTPEDVNHAAQVINQMIYYGALGVFFSQPTKLHTHTGRTYVVKTKFVEDFENPDFNNSYYEFSWKECEWVN